MSSAEETAALMARINAMVEQLREHIDELRAQTANAEKKKEGSQ